MTQFKCPKCNIDLVDPDLYYRTKKRGVIEIECPSCETKFNLKDLK